MIASDQVRLIEYIIDTSGATDILADGLVRDRRGRQFDRRRLRLLLIGLFLAINESRSATIRDVHRVLTRKLSAEDQIRLGVRDLNSNGTVATLDVNNLYSLIKRLSQGFGYGIGKQPDLDTNERVRRHGVIQAYGDALMDVFNLGFASTTYAIDATGMHAWARRRGKLDAVNDSTDSSDADSVNDPDLANSTIGATDTSQSWDPDAGWGVKTSKSGANETFFGFHEHTVVQVPHADQHPDAEPRIINRFEITAANNDVVDVSLRLLDRLQRPATDIIVDRHYHYKKVVRWLAALVKRQIRQHHDLRADELGFTEYQRLRFAAGYAHCPATPSELGELNRPAPNAPKTAFNEFRRQIELRERFSLKRITAVDASGAVRLQCPALDGRIGCPLRAGTVKVATINGLPVVENPPNPSIDREPLPKCCTQVTMTVTLPDPILKLAQPHYWGSTKWERIWNKRTAVEGTYGNRKNQSTENMRRGLHRFTGLELTHLVIGIVNASYNLRMLRNWHERTGLGPTDHPLLTPINDPDAFALLDKSEILALFAVHGVAA